MDSKRHAKALSVAERLVTSIALIVKEIPSGTEGHLGDGATPLAVFRYALTTGRFPLDTATPYA